MATYPARVLVLSKTKLREADLILTMLQDDGSRIQGIAKGARKTKSKLGGVLEPFEEADILLAKGKNLDIITEARNVETNEAIRADYVAGLAASVVCETAAKLSLEGQEQPYLFDLTLRALKSIGLLDEDRQPLFVAAYLIKLLSLLGYRPVLDECVFCGSPAGGDGHFSWRSGGAVCTECAREREFTTVDVGVVSWVRSLIALTFDELETCEAGLPLGLELLGFSQHWLLEHTDIKLRSLPLFSAAFRS